MTSSTHQICILLGSNILPEAHIPQAITQLSQRLIITGISSIWETAAVGSYGPDFLNAAVLAYSQLHPYRLKAELLRPMEAEMGRFRTTNKNAPRTIDLDIVVIDGRPSDPGLWSYAHIAVPVSELLPEMTHPTSGNSLQEIARQLTQSTSITRRSDLNLAPIFLPQPVELARMRQKPSAYLV